MTLLDRFGLEGKPALVVGGGYGIRPRGRAPAGRRGRAWRSRTSTVIARHRSAKEVNGVAVVGDVRAARRRAARGRRHARALGGLERVANIVGLATFVEDVFAIDTDTWGDLRINLVHHLDVSRAAARP